MRLRNMLFQYGRIDLCWNDAGVRDQQASSNSYDICMSPLTVVVKADESSYSWLAWVLDLVSTVA